MPTHKITEVAVSDLKPHGRNANKHPEFQLKMIEKSIREFGFIAPVVATKSGKNWTIVAGHGRVVAAARVGLEKIPVVDASSLTPAQIRAYMIADNRLAELSEWDETILTDELRELSEILEDVEVLGYTDEEIDELIKPPDEPGDTPGGSPRNALAYNVIFDTVEQQDKFFEWVKWLKENVAGETIGERISAFVRDGAALNYGIEA